jgi:hypothetical protein
MFIPPGWIATITAKLGVAVHERVRLAALAGVGYVDLASDAGPAAAAGGAITACIDERCRWLGSAFVHGTWLRAERHGADSSPEVTGWHDNFPLAFGAALQAPLMRHVKLTFDAMSVGAPTDTGGSVSEALVVSYGIRVFTRGLAAELGLVPPFSFEGGGGLGGALVLGVPTVDLSCRWGGRGP